MSSERTDDDDESYDIGDEANATHGPRKAPAWNYYEECGLPNATRNLRCKFCKVYFTGHATRVRAHLMGNLVKGDAPACTGLYNHVDLDEINIMYNVIKVPANIKYKLSDGSHKLTNTRVYRQRVGTPTSCLLYT